MSKTWNSINPATLSGAIDVIVVEQDDGKLHSKSSKVRVYKTTGLITHRFAGLFTLPCPLWEVFLTSAI